jgi:hypothetical protein
MASKDRFDVFKFFFTWEEDRQKSLTETGKIYLALISAFFAYLGYKLTDTQFSELIALKMGMLPWGLILYGAVFFFLLVGLAATLLTLFVHNYEQVLEPEEFFEDVVASGYGEEQFYDALIANFNVATRTNSRVNDVRALKLQVASYSLFLGFLLYGVVFLSTSWCKANVC